MSKPVFASEVYVGFVTAVGIVKKTIEPFGKFNVDDVLKITNQCAHDSEYIDKFKQLKTHGEEKEHLFKIEQKKEQQRLFINNFARCIPCKEALTIIKTFVEESHMLELNMHKGLWAALLRGIKVPKIDIIAPFADEEQDDNLYVKPLRWIKKKDTPDEKEPTSSQLYDMVQEHYNALLIVDPKAGNETNFAYECLQKFKGGKVVFIGFEEKSVIFDYLEEKFELTKHAEIPNWFDDADYVMCYDRIKM